MEALWAEYQNSSSYISTLVKDIVELIEPKLTLSLRGLRMVKVVARVQLHHDPALVFRRADGEIFTVIRDYQQPKTHAICHLDTTEVIATLLTEVIRSCEGGFQYHSEGQIWQYDFETLTSKTIQACPIPPQHVLDQFNDTHLLLRYSGLGVPCIYDRKKGSDGIFDYRSDLSHLYACKLQEEPILYYLRINGRVELAVLNLFTNRWEQGIPQSNLHFLGHQGLLISFQDDALMIREFSSGEIVRRWELPEGVTNFHLYSRAGHFYLVLQRFTEFIFYE